MVEYMEDMNCKVTSDKKDFISTKMPVKYICACGAPSEGRPNIIKKMFKKLKTPCTELCAIINLDDLINLCKQRKCKLLFNENNENSDIEDNYLECSNNSENNNKKDDIIDHINYYNNNILRYGTIIYFLCHKGHKNQIMCGKFMNLKERWCVDGCVKYGKGKIKMNVIIERLNEFGFKWPEGEIYVDSQTQFKCICKCGDIFMLSLCNLHKSKGCRKCSMQNLKEHNQKTYGVDSTSQREDVKAKIKTTVTTKFGASHISQTPYFKQKYARTIKRRYGENVTHTQQLQEVKQKQKDTIMRVHGVKHASLLPSVQEKSRKTFFSHYGTYKHSEVKTLMEKTRQTHLKRYGRHSAGTALSQARSQKTCMARYGVTHACKNPAIYKKMQQGSYKKHDYIFPSGKTARVQGYEPYALDLILKYIDENEIAVDDTSLVPTIDYKLNGKEHKYYPDIYVKKHNLIIEVKSQYTYDKEYERNMAKKEYTIEKGYNFRFLIMNKDKVINFF